MGIREDNGRRTFKEIPGSIRELLKLLADTDEDIRVTLILEAEEEHEHVTIEAVVGNLLVATIDCDKFKFIDIDCICAVIVDCEDILESILRGHIHRKGDKDPAHIKENTTTDFI
jgi:hypothetical protein